jgi:hypothetical protein
MSIDEYYMKKASLKVQEPEHVRLFKKAGDVRVTHN